jgi:penicillin-binding protein 1A
MAQKRRTSQRVPSSSGAPSPSYGFFGSRPKKAATEAAKPPARASKPKAAPKKPAAKAPAKKPPPKRPATRAPARKSPTRRKPRRGVIATTVHAVRKVVYWSVVAGIIAVFGLAGLVGYYWSKLPPTSEWALPVQPASVRIVSADGALITNRGDVAGKTLTLDEMPDYLPQAVIAIEDRRFWYHLGIDPIGLTRAAVVNLTAGGVVQGGSTLTQQLAKNLFLKPERTFERKVQEVILAVWLELSLSKREILELYLNRVYLGAGAYGVDAAAQRYFGKSAKDVTLAEAATLAGLLKAPTRYSPLLDRDASAERASLVLAAMHEEGYIDDRATSLALSDEVKPVRDVAGGSGRYVADWVMAQLPSFVGALDEDIVVETTIDLRTQAQAARALSATLEAEGPQRGVTQGAIVAMSPDGAVRAMVGGRDYGSSPFNRAVDALRQPGSSFKPFVFLAALEAGNYPESVRIDQPVTIRGWSPENYTRKYLGPVTLQSALALSLNTISAQLAAEVGPSTVAATARRLGIKSALQATPSIALGTSEVTLLEMTGAYATFANGGSGVIPHVIRRIRTENGRVLYERAGSGAGQVIHPAYVAMMNAMLAETMATGTGKTAAIPGWPAAGKTGTSQDFRDAWFIGYTGRIVAGVWFGNDNNKPTKKATGSNIAAAAWHRFMAAALEGVPVAALPGGYQVQDPIAVAGGPSPDSIAEQIAIVGEDGDVIRSAPAPLPPQQMAPTTTGAIRLAPPPERKGLFKRLFGG